MRVTPVVIWFFFIVFPGVAAAFSNDASWEATYPFGQAPAQKIVTAGLAPGYLEATSTVAGQGPPANSAVTSEHSLSSRSAITQSRPIGSPRGASKPPAWWTRPFHPHPPQAQNQMLYRAAAPSPWYETPLGIAGIGVVATGATMFLDHGINHYTETHLSYGFRTHVALNIADVLTDGSLIIAGASWFQSPWASAKFAHASSVALTSAAITTVEVFAMKYAIGRARPGGPNSSSTNYHPFGSSYSFFSATFITNRPSGNTASFPSGHTAIAFAVITPYAQDYHLPWLYAIPMVVGVSRILAQDGHWASDVVAGGFIGWLTADLTNQYFPNSDYGFMFFGNGVGVDGRF